VSLTEPVANPASASKAGFLASLCGFLPAEGGAAPETGRGSVAPLPPLAPAPSRPSPEPLAPAPSPQPAPSPRQRTATSSQTPAPPSSSLSVAWHPGMNLRAPRGASHRRAGSRQGPLGAIAARVEGTDPPGIALRGAPPSPTTPSPVVLEEAPTLADRRSPRSSIGPNRVVSSRMPQCTLAVASVKGSALPDLRPRAPSRRIAMQLPRGVRPLRLSGGVIDDVSSNT
jgi:hypothetical protein